jgi:hypothetical protein
MDLSEYSALTVAIKVAICIERSRPWLSLIRRCPIKICKFVVCAPRRAIFHPETPSKTLDSMSMNEFLLNIDL